MTAPSEHEAYLRAALHAAADSLEPRGDGLERIRTRFQHARPMVVVWMTAAWDELRLRTPAAVQDAFYRLGAGLQAAWDRFAPAPAPGKHRSRTQGLLRPLAAMAVAMFIVAAGTYVAIDASTAVSPSSTNVHPGNGQPRPGGHTGGGPAASPAHPGSRSGLGSGTLPASPSCTRATGGASPQPSSSPSTSPSPNPTPTPTDSATPSSPATSPSDGTGDAVSAVRLTAFLTVASSARPDGAPSPCASQSTTPVTPAPSTNAAETGIGQAPMATGQPAAVSRPHRGRWTRH